MSVSGLSQYIYIGQRGSCFSSTLKQEEDRTLDRGLKKKGKETEADGTNITVSYCKYIVRFLLRR